MHSTVFHIAHKRSKNVAVKCVLRTQNVFNCSPQTSLHKRHPDPLVGFGGKERKCKGEVGMERFSGVSLRQITGYAYKEMSQRLGTGQIQ